jgi:hypothetical protein
MAQNAFFEGLVFDERDQPVKVGFVGADAQYIVDDDGFHRHIDSEVIDRQVLTLFIEQLQQNKDMAVTQALNFMGKDDLFTKAAVASSIDQVDIDQILKQGLPFQARQMMGMMGFKIIVNVHGDIVDMRQPEIPDEE